MWLMWVTEATAFPMTSSILWHIQCLKKRTHQEISVIEPCLIQSYKQGFSDVVNRESLQFNKIQRESETFVQEFCENSGSQIDY